MAHKRNHYDRRAAAMRTMTIENAQVNAPIKCDGDQWILDRQPWPDFPPIEESIGEDEGGNPILVPVAELYPALA